MQPHAAGRSPAPQAAPRTGWNVLLADDDLAMRQYLTGELRWYGCKVREAKDGAALLDLLAGLALGEGTKEPPDVIISDIRMPCWSGLQVLTTLRNLGTTIPVILITAFGDDETIAEAKRLGAAAVLSKPFDIEDLINLITKHTRAREPRG